MDGADVRVQPVGEADGAGLRESIRRRIMPPKVLAFPPTERQPHFPMQAALPGPLIAAALEWRERAFHVVASIRVREFLDRRRRLQSDGLQDDQRNLFARRRLLSVFPSRPADVADAVCRFDRGELQTGDKAAFSNRRRRNVSAAMLHVRIPRSSLWATTTSNRRRAWTQQLTTSCN